MGLLWPFFLHGWFPSTLDLLHSPRILVRAISEGSTVVMKAISTNDEMSMKKAMATSPRGKRAQEQCPWNEEIATRNETRIIRNGHVTMSVKIRSRDSLRFLRLVERDALNFNIFALITASHLYTKKRLSSMRSFWTFLWVRNRSPLSTGPFAVAIWIVQRRFCKTCWPSALIVTYTISRAMTCLSVIQMWWNIWWQMCRPCCILSSRVWCGGQDGSAKASIFDSSHVSSPCGRRFLNPSHNLDRNSE